MGSRRAAPPRPTANTYPPAYPHKPTPLLYLKKHTGPRAKRFSYQWLSGGGDLIKGVAWKRSVASRRWSQAHSVANRRLSQANKAKFLQNPEITAKFLRKRSLVIFGGFGKISVNNQLE